MLEARALSREFGGHRVVDDVSFTVHPGRITGFVGANGAGKTTTMRMLMGVLAPSSGEVGWAGGVASAEDRRGFGYLPEERGLYPRMRVRDQLSFFAELHGMDPGRARTRAAELLDFFDLGDRADDVLDTLSLGNQQRVQIAAALVHHPTALVLDEPFSGLDPLAVDSMVELLRREAAELPVLFSSHQLDLVERLCDDVVVLAQGRVVAAGTVAELRGQDGHRFRVELADAAEVSMLDDVVGLRVVERHPEVVVELAGLDADDLVGTLAARVRLREVARVRRPLAEIFRDVAR